MKYDRKKHQSLSVRDIENSHNVIYRLMILNLFVVYTYVTVTFISPAVAFKCSRETFISNSVVPA